MERHLRRRRRSLSPLVLLAALVLARPAGADEPDAGPPASPASPVEGAPGDAPPAVRTEIARLVLEERARLEGVHEAQARAAAALAREREALGRMRDAELSKRRAAAEARARAERGELLPAEADAIWDAGAEELGRLQAALEGEVRALKGGEPFAPSPPERLLPASPETADADALRATLERAARELDAGRRELARARSRALREAIEQTSAERLGLLPHLSAQKRREAFSFGPQGFAEVHAEATRIGLALRLRLLELRAASRELFPRLQQPAVAFTLAVGLFQAALLLLVQRLWRAHAERFLLRLRQVAPKRLRMPGLAGLVERLLVVVTRIRQPAEALIVLGILEGIAGPLASTPEARAASLVLGWAFGGQLVVRGIDAFASSRAPDEEEQTAKRVLEGESAAGPDEPAEGEEPAEAREARGAGDADGAGEDEPEDAQAALRLRSLMLVGRAVVAFGLVLSLAALLVGKGAIYAWVLALCYASLLPLAAVLLRWWRPFIVEKMGERVRRKQDRFVSAWVIRAAPAWYGFLPAMAGAGVLFGSGAAAWARRRFGGLETSRRLLAYLFRRQVARRAEAQKAEGERPLDEARARAFDPERGRARTLSGVEKATVERLARVGEGGAARLALVVGERGAGKTTLLDRLASILGEDAILRVPMRRGLGGQAALAAALGAPDAGDEVLLERIERAAPRAILVDDVQRIVRPAVGGLDDLDRLLSLCRRAGGSWVFSMDSASFDFFRRARQAEPTFDEVVRLSPFTDEQIAQLLRSRTAAVRIRPSFEELVVTDLVGAERSTHVIRTEFGYYRLLWDYADGNPAVALVFWQRSLFEREGRVRVHLFEAPAIEELERLPNEARFVLRALLQLESATAREIAEVTRLGARDVESALRFALRAGYVERTPDCEEGRLRLSWLWYRAVTRFLRRKNLLASPG